MWRRQEEGRKDARGPQKEEGGEREKSQGSYRKPQEVTGSNREPQEATGSDRTRQEATGSHMEPHGATGSHSVPQQDTGSHKKPQEATGPYMISDCMHLGNISLQEAYKSRSKHITSRSISKRCVTIR